MVNGIVEKGFSADPGFEWSLLPDNLRIVGNENAEKEDSNMNCYHSFLTI
jgi:hypothetical protein